MSRLAVAFLIVTVTGLAHAQNPPFQYCPTEVWCKANVDDLADFCEQNPNHEACPCDESTQGYKCYESSDADACWEFRCVDCGDTSDCGTCANWVSENPCSAACGFRCCEVFGCLNDPTDATCLLGSAGDFFVECDGQQYYECGPPCDFGF